MDNFCELTEALRRLASVSLDWDESKHPRGNQKNAGQFAKKGTATSSSTNGGSSNSSSGRYSNTNVTPSDQYREIESKYRNTDKWMKAPNGKATNLTERQWVQVRTPSFKEWFGDWENDPANASKAVDDNGEPLVCSHMTDSFFTIFDISKFGKHDSGDFGKWFYFTPGTNGGGTGAYNKYYTNKMLCFLNVRNPIETNAGPASYGDHGRLLTRSKRLNNAEVFTNEILSEGYDGIFANYGLEIGVHDPTQIKSATGNDGLFSNKHQDIMK